MLFGLLVDVAFESRIMTTVDCIRGKIVIELHVHSTKLIFTICTYIAK